MIFTMSVSEKGTSVVLAGSYSLETQYGVLEIPSGFSTDFASVPRAFWGIFPPFGRYSVAAVAHDYLYSTQALSRKAADDVFLYLMKKHNVGFVSRTIMYFAVRIFGGIAWRK